MKILVTGAKGFVGRNLCSQLRNIAEGKARWYDCPSDLTIFEYDVDSPKESLDDYCREADFVFNLAGVNRPKDPAEFMQGNFGFASLLLDTLKRHHNTCPVMISSSIQALLDNPYGESKRAGEKLLFDYADKTQMQFLGFQGKPAGYFIIFCYCAVAYLLGWLMLKAFVPRYKAVQG